MSPPLPLSVVYKTTAAVLGIFLALLALLGFGFLDYQHPSAQIFHFEKANVLATPYPESLEPTQPLVMQVALRDGPRTAQIPLRMDPKPLHQAQKVIVSYRLTYLTQQKIDLYIVSDAL